MKACLSSARSLQSKHCISALWIALAIVSAEAAAGRGPGGPGGNAIDGGTSPTPLPFDTVHFSSAGKCAVCHNDLTDQAGNDVSLQRDWSATMMAHSSRDPLWQAKVASERARAPHLAEVIDAKCSRCHMPMANVELSHAVPAERTIYGPVPSPRINPMQRQSGFRPTYAMHAGDSALCATCHNLKTPFVDAEGNLMSTDDPASEFADQMPYMEWEHSAFGPGGATPRSCQSCHMPETDGVRLANRPRWLAPVDGFSRHRFVGANTTMLDILDRNREALEVTSGGLDTAIADARDMLAGAAELALVEARIDGAQLRVELDMINRSGHKLPTSFPSRRAWLHLTVTDRQGRVVFESGRLEADGRIAGADGDTNPSAYEPHHRVISSADQVQIYEPVMGDTDGNVTHTLLRAGTYLKDNRLTPQGFTKADAPDDVAVAGLAAEDPDFDAGVDRVTYLIPVSGNGALTVRAELNYQVLSRPFLQDLFRDDSLPEVARFRAMYEDGAILAENIAALQVRVPR